MPVDIKRAVNYCLAERSVECIQQVEGKGEKEKVITPTRMSPFLLSSREGRKLLTLLLTMRNNYIFHQLLQILEMQSKGIVYFSLAIFFTLNYNLALYYIGIFVIITINSEIGRGNLAVS